MLLWHLYGEWNHDKESKVIALSNQGDSIRSDFEYQKGIHTLW